jgi:hypothetical protein
LVQSRPQTQKCWKFFTQGTNFTDCLDFLMDKVVHKCKTIHLGKIAANKKSFTDLSQIILTQISRS